MDLMSKIGEYQTKESPGRIIWEHYTTMSPEKHDSSREERMSSLPEYEWAVAESQRRMTKDKVKSFYSKLQHPEKQASSWEERLTSLPGGERPVAETQGGMTQRMRRMATKQTKEIEKESINILIDAT